MYQDLYAKYRQNKADATIINDDLVFEMELLKQVDINIDYILMLVKKFHDGNCQDKRIIADIERAIGASYELRDKKDLIDRFIDGLDASEDVDSDWRAYVAEARRKELAIIVDEEALDPEATERFVERAFADGGVTETGTEVAALMTRKPSRFAPADAYSEAKGRVIEKLKAYVKRFLGLDV